MLQLFQNYNTYVPGNLLANLNDFQVKLIFLRAIVGKCMSNMPYSLN